MLKTVTIVVVVVLSGNHVRGPLHDFRLCHLVASWTIKFFKEIIDAIVFRIKNRRGQGRCRRRVDGGVRIAADVVVTVPPATLSQNIQ